MSATLNSLPVRPKSLPSIFAFPTCRLLAFSCELGWKALLTNVAAVDKCEQPQCEELRQDVQVCFSGNAQLEGGIGLDSTSNCGIFDDVNFFCVYVLHVSRIHVACNLFTRDGA